MSASPGTRLTDLHRCFQGVIPSIVATSDSHGVPNVTYVSQIHFVDDRHVALSCQFFNKTRRNLDENPRATAEVYDPATMQPYRLRLRFLRSEKSGPLFDTMAMRIDAIASHTGMAGIFRLIAADVFEVLSVEKVDGFLSESAIDDGAGSVSLTGLRTELRGLQLVSERINRAEDLESLLESVLEALESYFVFNHTMILLPEEGGRLVTVASRGYGESGVGAEVAIGEGLIGTVGRERKLLRIAGLEEGLRYGRAIRREVLLQEGPDLRPEIPLPGLADAQSALVIPLAICDRLVGVLAAESRDPLRFGEWHEAYLEVIGNQIALGIDRILQREDEEEDVPPSPAAVVHPSGPRSRVVYYRGDDSIFVDDEYLIRNVPARILWRLLADWKSRRRSQFTNRELRVDESLGLPDFKDNLESRLILLRKRLDEKCPQIRIIPTGRGRFALNVSADLDLVEA